MASAAATPPNNLVPFVLFPTFIVLAIIGVGYISLKDCDCDVPHAEQPRAEARSEARNEREALPMTNTRTEPAFPPKLMERLGVFASRKLPSNVELSIPANGIENRLLGFIQDKSKPADNTTWFNFDRLLFDTGEATLKAESGEQLQNIAEIMKVFPAVSIKIGGYTDSVGNAATNKKLSEARAQSVMKELQNRGVDAKRLAAEGYGQQFPVASNATEDGREQNRRVAVRVTKK
jgi:outer membrane protein OmpA-like peptidoglycan-associated protein